MNKIDKKLLTRYFQKQCSREEAELVVKWLSDPANKAEIDQLMAEKWHDEVDETSSYDTEGVYDNIINEINTESRGGSNKKSFGLYLAAAAVVSLLVVASIIYFQARSEKTAPALAYITKTAERGDKLTTQLPDGSIVTLNSGSEINYSKTFGTSDRNISLKGEALFDVAKDSERPFIVSCGEMSVTAVGTVFNINSFEAMKEAKVTLLSGKVNVKAEAHQVSLEKGEAALFSKEAKALTKMKEDVDASALWADGIIHFNKTPISEVINTLERWYDVDIQMVNEPNPAPVVHGSFENAKLGSVLKSIGFALEFDHERTNENVIIEFRN